ncbi:MAG: MaoC family dehydratase [Acidimicrobiia bacterium]
MTSRTALPTLRRTIDQTDMVAYAGATWDWHRLHHDIDYARSKGLEGTVVDGQMFGAMMAAQLSSHFGTEWRVSALDFRFVSMVYAGETVEVAGVIEEDSEAEAACTHTVSVGDRICATGTSKVTHAS